MVLSKEQKEILEMITKEFLTPKQIANRRGTSIQSVYKTINKLKAKGLIFGNSRGGFKIPMPVGKGGFKNLIRLHGEIYNIKFLSTKTYTNLRKQRNRIEIDGNTIKLFKNSIMIYINRGFIGKNSDYAEIEGEKYRHLFFKQLEDRLKLHFLKIKRVSQHYAELNNELAKQANNKKEQIRIKGDDKKTWLLTDNSFNLNELEAIHPELAKEDIDKIQPFFNDIRNNPVKLSDILSIIKVQAEHNKETAAGLTAIVEIMKTLNLGVTTQKLNTSTKKDKTIPEYFG